MDESSDKRELSGRAAARAAQDAEINALAKTAYGTYAESGQPSAFNDLLGKLYPWTRVTLRTSFGIQNHEVREDLLQEIARRFVVYRDSYNEQEGSFLAWWYGIIRNVRKDNFSDSAKQRAADASFTPSQSHFDAEKKVILQDALDKLHKDDREILVMHYILGLTAPEIARILDQKVDDVKYEIRRASAHLRELLKSGTNRATPSKPEDKPGASPPS